MSIKEGNDMMLNIEFMLDYSYGVPYGYVSYEIKEEYVQLLLELLDQRGNIVNLYIRSETYYDLIIKGHDLSSMLIIKDL